MPMGRLATPALLCALVGTGVPAAGLAAQAVPLGEPTAVLADDFGSIQTVRELPDGRVLVADPLGRALYAVDMEAGTRTVIGREGQGPREYLQPDAVWPLPGDSTLLVDLGNGRTVALGPDLSFGPTLPIALGEPRPGATLVLAIPQAVDGAGRIYARGVGALGGELPDSAAVLRIDRGTRAADTAAVFKLEDRRRIASGGGSSRNVRIESVPLSPQDAWGVAPDGAVVIARAGDYHVEWVSPSGAVTRGPAIEYEPVDIGTAEKEEWIRNQGRAGGGIGISMQVVNGSVSMSFARGGGSGRDDRDIDDYEWPATKPPFQPDRLAVDPYGRAWVHRHVEVGEPSTYDLFDRSGGLARTVTLDPGKRVVGFGAGSVYVVAYDELDLNYLERYPLPPR
jgi:hypothetical protein